MQRAILPREKRRFAAPPHARSQLMPRWLMRPLVRLCTAVNPSSTTSTSCCSFCYTAAGKVRLAGGAPTSKLFPQTTRPCVCCQCSGLKPSGRGCWARPCYANRRKLDALRAWHHTVVEGLLIARFPSIPVADQLCQALLGSHYVVKSGPYGWSCQAVRGRAGALLDV